MKSFYLRFKSFINTITGSIAFYPTFYAVIALIIALSMGWLESRGISKYLQENAPALVVNDVDTARNILTTIIGGGISILVFSFSMVMLLLSQAATNYSPRVLPSLISNKTHQIILGAFISSIIFNIITLLNIEPSGKSYQVPGFSVLLGIISALISLGAFVYFIHSISSSIQINEILRNIYNNAKDQLLRQIAQDDKSSEFADSSNWNTFHINDGGTLQNISNAGILSFCKEYDVKIEVLASKGEYLINNSAILKHSKELNEDQKDELLKNFLFNESEIVRDNYLLGFKQITEIGIKAMSPGINDPGTAMDTISFLTDLFALRLKRTDKSILKIDDKEYLKLKIVPFNQLIHNILAQYRNYCKHDFIVMRDLIIMLKKLKNQDRIKEDYLQVLEEQLELLLSDAENGIDNKRDLEILQEIAAS